MKRFYPFLALLAAVAFSGGLVYALSVLAVRAFRFLASFESEVAAALVATSGTVLIALITLLLTHRESKRREAREAHRSEKVAVYKRFMEAAVVDVLRRGIDGTKMSEEEMLERYQEFFLTFTGDLIVWGSPGVIQAFRRFRIASVTGHENALALVDAILQEIRKDLGNSNWGIGQGDLISTFLKDPREFRELAAGRALKQG